MTDIRTAKFLSINLGQITREGEAQPIGGSFPDMHFYLSLVSFDIYHEGNTYKSNGVALSISPIKETLKLEKTSTIIELSAIDSSFTMAFNTKRYRNKPCTIYVAQVNPDGSLSHVRSTTMYGDSHQFKDGKILFTIHSVWARFEQNRGNKTSSGQQQALITRGLFEGVSEDSIDYAFENAAQDFSGIVLGEQAAGVSVTKVRGGFLGLKKIKTKTPIPGSPGEAVSDDGSDYVKELPYGATLLEGNLIAAWNPNESQVTSKFGDLTEWVAPPERVVKSTRYLCLIYAICEGPLKDITISIEDQNIGSAGAGWRFINNSETGELFDYKYTFRFEESAGYQTTYMTSSRERNKRIAFVAAVDGRDNQEAMSDFVSLGEGKSEIWTNDHKGYGTALVGILLQASTLWDGGVPGVYFFTSGKIVNGVDNYKDVTESPHHIIYDFLTDKRFGPGINPNSIDIPSFVEAGPIYNRNFTGQNYSAFIRGVISGTGSYREGIQFCLDASQSNLITNREGKISLLAKGYQSDSDLGGTIQNIDLSRSDRTEFTTFTFAQSSEVYNQVNLTVPIVNRKPGQNYEITVIDKKALEEDNFQKSALDLTVLMLGACLSSDGEPLLWTDEATKELANAELCRSRLFTKCSFETFAWNYLDLKCGDIIGLSDPLYLPPENSVVPFRIQRLELEDTSTLKIECVEYSNNIYDISSTVAMRAKFTRIGGDFGSGFSINSPSAPQNLRVYFEEDLTLNGRFRLEWNPPLTIGTEDLIDNSPLIYNIYGGRPIQDVTDIDTDGDLQEFIASSEEFIASVTTRNSRISYSVPGRLNGRETQNYFHVVAINSHQRESIPAVVSRYAPPRPVDLDLPGSFPAILDTHRFSLIIDSNVEAYKIKDNLIPTLNNAGVAILNGSDPILVRVTISADVIVGGTFDGALIWSGFPVNSIFDLILHRGVKIIGRGGRFDPSRKYPGLFGYPGNDAIRMSGLTYTSIRGVEGEAQDILIAGGGGEGGVGGVWITGRPGVSGEGGGWDDRTNTIMEAGTDGSRAPWGGISPGGAKGEGGAGGVGGVIGLSTAGGGGGGGVGGGGGGGGTHGPRVGERGLNVEEGGFGGKGAVTSSGYYSGGAGGDAGKAFFLSNGARFPVVGFGIEILAPGFRSGTVPNIAPNPIPISNPNQDSEITDTIIRGNPDETEVEIGDFELATLVSFQGFPSASQSIFLSRTSPSGFRVGHIVSIVGQVYTNPSNGIIVLAQITRDFIVQGVSNENEIFLESDYWPNAGGSSGVLFDWTITRIK